MWKNTIYCYSIIHIIIINHISAFQFESLKQLIPIFECMEAYELRLDFLMVFHAFSYPFQLSAFQIKKTTFLQ